MMVASDFGFVLGVCVCVRVITAYILLVVLSITYMLYKAVCISVATQRKECFTRCVWHQTWQNPHAETRF